MTITHPARGARRVCSGSTGTRLVSPVCRLGRVFTSTVKTPHLTNRLSSHSAFDSCTNHPVERLIRLRLSSEAIHEEPTDNLPQLPRQANLMNKRKILLRSP